MALDLSNKALTMMLKTVIGSLGIDGQALLDNLIQFQQFVLGQIQHHDKRLVSIEVAVLEQNQLLRELLAIAEKRAQLLENENVGRAKSGRDFIESGCGLRDECTVELVDARASESNA